MFHITNNLSRILPVYYNCPANLTPPPGLLLDLQITVPTNDNDSKVDNNRRVVIRSLRVDGSGKVYIKLTFDTDELELASIHTDCTGTPVKMESIQGVVAHVLLGAIPAPAEYASPDPIQVNPALVHFYNPHAELFPRTRLEVIQDGDFVFNEVLERNIVLRVFNPELFYNISEAGVVTVDSSATSGLDLVTGQVGAVQTSSVYRNINSINNVHPYNGVLSLNIIAADAEDLVATKDQGASVSLTCSKELNARLAPEDILDKHFKSGAEGEYTYYPLDDIYCPGSNVSTGKRQPGDVRNTFVILGGTPPLYEYPYVSSFAPADETVYDGLCVDTGALAVSGSTRSIRTLVPIYDLEECGSKSK